MNLKIGEFFVYLLQRKNFYGRLAASLQRVAKPGMGTMAVGVYKGRITLYYDPEFIANISMGAAMFVLEHEMLHLVLDHIPRYLELLSHCHDDDERLKAGMVSNIAMDCAINSLLREHKHFGQAETFTKEWCLKRMVKDAADREALREQLRNEGVAEDDLPPTFTQEEIDKATERAGMCLPEKYNLPDKRSFELYQELLMKRINVINLGGGISLGSFHGLWGDEGEDGKGGEPVSVDELTAQANRLREQLKRVLRSAVRSSGGMGRGLMPSEVEEFLQEYLADPIIPWWEIFMTRAKTSKTSKFRRSVIVPNRSLLALAEEDDDIIPNPGRIRDKSWRIFWMRDTSGSMSTESLEIANNELNHALQADEGMEIRAMDGDASVHRDVLLKQGDEIPRSAVGRGGTDFDAYFEYMKQYVYDDSTRPDLVVVYTDGYAPAVSEEHRLPADIPVIWLVTPQHSKEHLEGYGEVIVCDPSHNDLYSH